MSDDKELKKRIVKQHEDIYDISWSPSGKVLACGSVNHITYLWDVEKSKMIGQLREHTNYVQGVAWDPHGVLLATQSSDRSVKVFSAKEEKKRKSGKPLPGWSSEVVADRCQRTLKYLSAPSPAGSESGNAAALSNANESNKQQQVESESESKKTTRKPLFAEGVPSFFRRLDWTPDGAFLIAPTGIYSPDEDPTVAHRQCLYLIER